MNFIFITKTFYCIDFLSILSIPTMAIVTLCKVFSEIIFLIYYYV